MPLWWRARSERPGGGKVYIWHARSFGTVMMATTPYILCTWMRVVALYMAEKSC